MNWELTEQIIWITGAARGIGKAIAHELALSGASLALTDVLESELQSTTAELKEQYGTRAICGVLDVTDSSGADNWVQRCVSELGGLTALINNAGVTRDGLLIRMSDEDWDRVLNVNLKGAFVCSRSAARTMMKARYGKIVNISSVVGVMGNAGQANYASSKAGLIGLSKSIAKELGGRGIRCNAVAPGFISTEMTYQLTEETKQAYAKAIPLGAMGRVEDVARVCAFLVSRASDYVTGQVFPVDGGLHM